MAMLDKMELFLNENIALSIAVIVPNWLDSIAIMRLYESPFFKDKVILKAKKHHYLSGEQHKVGKVEFTAVHDTAIIFLQNELGSQRWPVNESNKSLLSGEEYIPPQTIIVTNSLPKIAMVSNSPPKTNILGNSPPKTLLTSNFPLKRNVFNFNTIYDYSPEYMDDWLANFGLKYDTLAKKRYMVISKLMEHNLFDMEDTLLILNNSSQFLALLDQYNNANTLRNNL